MNDAQESQRSEPVDHAGVAFHPPLLLALALLIGFGARWIVSLEWVPGALAVFVGPAVTAVSFGLFFWAAYTMRAGDASIPTNCTGQASFEGRFGSFASATTRADKVSYSRLR